MPGTLPEGEPVPDDGSLPCDATQGFGDTPFGVYVHVPFCRTRCGYCDFNTYTAAELGASGGPGGGGPGGGGPSVSQATYHELVVREIDLAVEVLPAPVPAVSTVFFGGGTP